MTKQQDRCNIKSKTVKMTDKKVIFFIKILGKRKKITLYGRK